MTKLLDEAVAKVRGLSDAEQDRVAAMLLGFADRDVDRYQLTPEQLAEVELARSRKLVTDCLRPTKRWLSCGGVSACENPMVKARNPATYCN